MQRDREKPFTYAYLPGTHLLQTLTKPNNMTLTQSYEPQRDLLTGMCKISKNLRIAPVGNRTGHKYGELPHYHRRGIDKSGSSIQGQGIGRHRPWETKATDRSFLDRF